MTVPAGRVAALLRRQQARTRDPVPADRVPFTIDGRIVGSVAIDDARLLSVRVPALEFDATTLAVPPACAQDVRPVLDAIAVTLRDEGRIKRWRNERLAVVADDDSVLGGIERGCARLLGIRTFAVHLIGATSSPPHGRRSDRQSGPDPATGVWLQRRAPDKDVDPGRLDTLAGGLVGMSPDGREIEAFLPALTREVHEEAGLLPDQYAPPIPVGRWRSHCNLSDGWMVEDMLVYRSHLLPATTPENRDGEVSEFLHVSIDRLCDLIEADELTVVASIALLLSLQDMGMG